MAIRTLTEFSGTLIRMASKAEAAAKKALPKELAAVAPASAPADTEVTAQSTIHKQGAGEAPHAEPEVEGGPGEKSESGAFSSATEAVDEELSKEKAAAAETHEAKKPETIDAETDAVKAILDVAVAEATGTKEDRLARIREAVRAVGGRADRVRLVRVYGVEEPVAGATRVGEHQYLVDLMPASMKQEFKDPRDDKNAKRGPRKTMGTGKPKGPEGSLEGSFSMETVAADRKTERTLPGARKPGGPGGARPGGRPGARPGGAPGGRPAGRPGAGKPAGK